MKAKSSRSRAFPPKNANMPPRSLGPARVVAPPKPLQPDTPAPVNLLNWRNSCYLASSGRVVNNMRSWDTEADSFPKEQPKSSILSFVESMGDTAGAQQEALYALQESLESSPVFLGHNVYDRQEGDLYLLKFLQELDFRSLEMVGVSDCHACGNMSEWDRSSLDSIPLETTLEDFLLPKVKISMEACCVEKKQPTIQTLSASKVQPALSSSSSSIQLVCVKAATQMAEGRRGIDRKQYMARLKEAHRFLLALGFQCTAVIFYREKVERGWGGN